MRKEKASTNAPESPRSAGSIRFPLSFRRLTSDLLLVLAALLIAGWIGKGQIQLPFETGTWPEFISVGVGFLVFALARRLDRIELRYVGLRDFLNIALVGAMLSVWHFVTQAVLQNPLPAFGPAVSTIFGFLSVAFLVTSYLLHVPHRLGARPGQEGARTVVIVGAGDAGEMVVREMIRGTEYRPVAFVDDDRAKLGQTIHAIPVLGTVADLGRVVVQTGAEVVLIATPSAANRDKQRLYDTAIKTRAKVRVLPALKEIILGENQSLVGQIRDILPEDLLNRDPVQINVEELSGYLKGQRVLITGAGGSIGSELARQVSDMRPSQLILLGRGENSVYSIQQELLRRGAEGVQCVIADVRDRRRMERVFAQTRPNIVFHAAAHKHVPLMEANPIEAVINNIFGTYNITECAARFGASRFIYISTDKAVEPTSIMGATKRVGEMIVQTLASRSDCRYTCVRFGNVLGSRGSVVPLMVQQIREGGPVTVTHEDMTRFFMTIPEAVSLILQAGAIGEGHGDIYVLDMGEPVKIDEMARNLIMMHGLIPDQDIQVIYTGLRPGEKMHEQLSSDFEQLSPTGREKINQVSHSQILSQPDLQAHLKDLQTYCEAMDENALRVTVMDLAWGRLFESNPLADRSAPAKD